MDDEIQAKDDTAEIPVNTRTDPWISSMADYANIGLGVGITVQSQGMLISGMLTSNVEFFELIKQNWGTIETAGNVDAETAEASRKALVDHAVCMIGIAKERNAKLTGGGGKVEFNPALYLHLKNVRLIVPGSSFMRFDSWRCRIDQISGFTMGVMLED